MILALSTARALYLCLKDLENNWMLENGQTIEPATSSKPNASACQFDMCLDLKFTVWVPRFYGISSIQATYLQ